MGAPAKAHWSILRDGDALAVWEELGPCRSWDTVFSATHFLDAIDAHSRVGINQVALVDGNGPAAAARLGVRTYAGVPVSPVPPFTAFSAVRFRDDLKESEVLERKSMIELLLQTIESRFHAAAIHLPPSVQDTRVLSWRGWKVRPLYTYRIELNPSVDPTAAWSESARRIARQESSNFEIIKADAETQTKLTVESYSRNGKKPPVRPSRIAPMVDSMAESGLARIVAARHKESGDLDASVTVLRHETEAYYWLAGGRRGPAMTVLLSTLLPELAAEGVQAFDFVGANTASIAEFKRKFGGRLTTYFRATWRRGLIGRVLSSRV